EPRREEACMAEPVAGVGAPSLLYLIKQVELAAKVELEEAVARHGITSVQYTALSVLARNPGITATRLAQNSFVTIQSMAQLIAGLETRGLLRREPDPRSRRQNLISITAAGQRILDSLRDPVRELEQSMLAGLSTEETVELVRALGRIRHTLSGA